MDGDKNCSPLMVVRSQEMFEHFSSQSRKAMAQANLEAIRLKHPEIDTGHILLGLLKDNDTGAKKILVHLTNNIQTLQDEIAKRLRPGDKPIEQDKLPQTVDAKRAINMAVEEARLLARRYVGTEHILLALLRFPTSAATKALNSLNLSYERVRETAISLAASDPEAAEETKNGPTVDALREFLATYSSGNLLLNMGQAFEVKPHMDGATIIFQLRFHRVITREMLKGNEREVSSEILMSTAERLNELVSELREGAKTLKAVD
jgi:ATP-dependent Clp protease ATP-binding subunit ClpC